jgi:tetratricopeptide (TPR) repeat protein
MTSNENILKASEDDLAPVYKFYFNAQYQEALSVLDKLNKDFPKDPVLFISGGDCYVPLKQYELAILCYEEALKLSPDNIKIYRKKIEVLVLSEKIEEGLELCNQAIIISPSNSDLYLTQGNIYQVLGCFDKAIDSYDEVINLNPNSADAFCNKSNTLMELRKFDEAVASAKKAIQIKPDLSLAFFNLATALMHLRLFDLSMKSFNKAIELKPNFAKYKHGKALLLLLFGDFKNGWSLWESRWKLDKLFSPKLKTNRPLWTGDKNSKLLVWGEQGVGDQIMYSGLLPDLSIECHEIRVQVEPRLVSLLNRSMGDKCIFYPENEPLTFEYDEHIPIGSLCQYLRRNEINFESSRYGFLKDDELKTAEIKKDLVALTPSNHKICGISWRSVSQKTGIHKTIPLKYFIETLDLEGYTFVNLQYGDTKDEIQKVRKELGVNIISYDEVDNFMDIDGLSSLIQACDTVITIDNVTCQLAGALGKETHILLSFDPWWGWMIDSNKSPWHPSLNLYRQEKINDWDGAFKKLKIAFF